MESMLHAVPIPVASAYRWQPKEANATGSCQVGEMTIAEFNRLSGAFGVARHLVLRRTDQNLSEFSKFSMFSASFKLGFT